MTRDAEQQKYSEIAALVSVTVGRERFRNAEPRFYTAWVVSRRGASGLGCPLSGHSPTLGADRFRHATINFGHQMKAGQRCLTSFGFAMAHKCFKKSSVTGLTVRFFNRMLTMGGALTLNLTGKTLNDICATRLRNTDAGKTETNRPVAIRCTLTKTESAATLATGIDRPSASKAC